MPGWPLPAGLASGDLGYHVFFCQGQSVTGKHLSLVLLLSGFTVGPFSLYRSQIFICKMSLVKGKK